MIIDKKNNEYHKRKLQPLIYNHQHGVWTGMSRATAKKNLYKVYYSASKKPTIK